MSRRIVVVGAGVSGLSAAHRVLELKPDWNVTVLEASSRPGGLIRTEQIEGCVVEQGPDAILTEKPAALKLAERLGLQGEVQSTNAGGRGAYVVHDAKLERIPQGFSMMAPSEAWPILSSPVLSAAGKLRMFAELLLPRGPELEDESVASFVRRRFGQEVLERLAQPLMSGIYGTDPAQLSLKSTMPRFIDLERKHRSVTLGLLSKRAAERSESGRNGLGPGGHAARSELAKGARYGLFVSFKRGNQTLIDALRDVLGTRIVLQRALRTVSRTDTGYQLRLDDGTQLDADGVVLAVPASAMAPALAQTAPKLSTLLSEIEFGSTVTVAYAWPQSQIAHPLDAFGFVVPQREGRALIASTWASKKFAGRAPAGQALIRVFFGGDHGSDTLQRSDHELIDLGREELESLIGVCAPPLFATVARQTAAMPKYTLGHSARVRAIEQDLALHPALALAGNSLYGVGIPDAIAAGERGAERLCTWLERQS